ncbi:MAG: tRNA pseudouridine(55) synthase TruB [Candidatus Melainabacteria bacterium]|nr:tRNA pseudouridine(55) synthase TruB [Candidatus Melainabacteria bacterium]
MGDVAAVELIGFLNVFKDRGMTSHDVINRLRKITGIKQIGHGGTLDPMAEGVMAVAIGKACRLLQFLDDDKTYLAEIKLGQVTDTDDVEGKTLSLARDLSHIERAEVELHLKKFVGKLQQIPPIYSAIKKGGVKMYELARKGEAPEEMEARSVEVYSLEFIDFVPPHVTVRVACSKGTYIRSIARDLGQMLGVGGCLSKLLRERSGPFQVEQSQTLDSLKDAGKENFAGFLLPLAQSLRMTTIDCDSEFARKLAHGQVLDGASVTSQTLEEEFYIASLDDKPVALVRLKDGKLIQPEVVLANAAEI